MTHYDVVVLGAGPGGYVAAIRAAQLGLNTAIVEPKYWGGVCLNVGCIPSKALLRNAELAHIFNKEAKTFGISGEVTFDYGAAFDRSRKVAEGRVAGVHFLMKKNKITEIHGYGKFTDAHTLSVELNEGGTETVTFDNVIIATGSSTRLVPGTSLSKNVVTYEELILSRELPESIIIAGAGAIGIEFAYVLKNYGVDVTIVEFLPRALPNEDVDVSKEIEKQYKKLGVKILTGTKVESIDDDGSVVTVTVSKDGKTEELKAAKVLQAIGFAPNVDGFGLDKAGVALTDRKAIGVTDYLRTNVDHIYAIGDVTGLLQLAHVAEAQGVVAAETIAGAETLALGDYPHAAARDLLPAERGELRAHRAAGPRRGVRRRGRQVPVHRQRQGARRRRPERLRQTRCRRQTSRIAGRTPGRPRRLGAAARADAGAEVGPDRK